MSDLSAVTDAELVREFHRRSEEYATCTYRWEDVVRHVCEVHDRTKPHAHVCPCGAVRYDEAVPS